MVKINDRIVFLVKQTKIPVIVDDLQMETAVAP